MKVGLSLFIGISLSVWIVLAFVLENIINIHFAKIRKEMHLAKRKCEICGSLYFVSIFFEWWRCPLCGSINKEHPQDSQPIDVQ